MGNKTTSPLVERDYAKKPPTTEEIETIFGDDPIPLFLNTRREVYKEHGFAQTLPPCDELIQLILAEPNLLRRAILRKGNQVLIGFDKEAFVKLVD